MTTPPLTNASAPSPKTSISRRRPASRGTGRLVGIAAVLLIFVSIGGYVYHRIQVAEIASEHLRFVVTGPATIQSGAAALYEIQTSGLTGDPLASQIEFDFYLPEGKRLSRKETTNERGRLEVIVPGDMSLPGRATIRVRATHCGQIEEFSAPVEVKPARFLAQLSLDRPLYQPGETLFYRGLILNRFGLTEECRFSVELKILDPHGTVLPNSSWQGEVDHGVGSGAFTFPAELPGGQYTLVLRSLDGAFPEARRNFFLRTYRLPRLKKELTFARDSYAPGETIQANLSVARAEGGPAAGAKLKITAVVDGEKVFEKAASAGADGRFAMEFKLPEKIARGDGLLAVMVDDGAARETMA
jgi:hypothetical protein